MYSRARLLLLLALLVTPVLDAAGQRRGRGNMYGSLGDPNEFYTPPDFNGNAKYDGRFTFARIKYRGFQCFHVLMHAPVIPVERLCQDKKPTSDTPVSSSDPA